jgi:hypothetical protein
MCVIKESAKKFTRSLCVTSRFVALLDEKSWKPKFPAAGRREMHKFTLGAAILPALDGYADPRGRRLKRILTDVQFRKGETKYGSL